MGNAKSSIICPHCGKENIEFEYDDKTKEIKKVKGGSWKAMLTKVDETHWTDSPNSGVFVKCNCGGQSVIYDIFTAPKLQAGRLISPIRTEPEPAENQLIGIFCPKCREAFLGRSFTCPSCGTKS